MNFGHPSSNASSSVRAACHLWYPQASRACLWTLTIMLTFVLAIPLVSTFLASPMLPKTSPVCAMPRTAAVSLNFLEALKAGFENDPTLAKTRPDHTEGVNKDAPAYVIKAKKQAMHNAMKNMVAVKFGSKGGMVKPGSNLLREARKHGMKIKSDCLRGQCGTCSCRVDGRIVRACVTTIEKPRFTKAINVQLR